MAKRLWRWQGLNTEGEPCCGHCWAANRTAVCLQLLEQHLHPLSIRRCSVNRQLWRAGHKVQIIRQLAALLQAGLTLTEGLALLAEQQPAAQWQALLTSLMEDVRRGIPFSQALQQWPEVFPPLYLSLIQTGELTGKLDNCCQQLAAQQEQQLRLQQQVIKALRYPLFIFMVAVAVTLGMAGFVLPQFAAIYQSFNTPLPAITRAVIAFSQGLTDYGIWGIAVIPLAATSVLIARRRPAWQIAEQQLLIRLPLFGYLLRGQRLSQFYTVLAMTQQAGIPLLQGLAAVENTLNSILWQQATSRLRQGIAAGSPYWQAISQESLFTPLCAQLIRTGEETGALDLMLARLAQWHSEQTRQKAETLASSLEPIMMLAIGAIVGTLVVAMYLPIFQLGDAMGGV